MKPGTWNSEIVLSNPVHLLPTFDKKVTWSSPLAMTTATGKLFL